MYNQSYNSSAVYGGGCYGADYQQQYYYQPQQLEHQHHPTTQQQFVQQNQQMIAGVMGYYPPEAAALFYNPYAYDQYQQTAYHQGAPFNQLYPHQQQHYQAPVDYQLTPALYLLHQQAELLQKSAHQEAQTKKIACNAAAGAKCSRKPRGPYKRRTNKSLSPTKSPAPELETDSDRLSSSDVSGANNRSATSIQSLDQQPLQRKRKSDSFLELQQQQMSKQCKLSEEAPAGMQKQRTQSIFCSVAMMAESSCTVQR